MRPTTPNILAVFDAATPAQWEQGMTWYSRAHALAVALDPAEPRRAAAVIAVLSPMKEWTQNADLARRAYANGGLDGGTLGAHVAKVNRLLRDREDPDTVVSGEKVTAFFEGIASNGKSDTAVIDRHAWDAAVGVRHTDDTRKIGRADYAAADRAYRRAAKARGVSVQQMQAVVWVVWRDIYKYTRKTV